MKTIVDPKTITKRLRRDTWNAMDEYKMLEEGGKIMVCVSGGKDSYTMLDMLLHYQKASGINFENSCR
jgi:tRNA 2-thiocytidine biosynthesis protein TtcA